ncbi:Rrf2 family transcriptional regulator [Streptomyces sp. H27-S2]|nr:Rrf2 family transcriptional regulator [Streptomyces sp. H27-S2]MCY0953998.1 Rrf2 family transcriptional regulator [Streptomyces sp. H27-S2]
MSEGVEWALHSCVNLAWSGPGRAVSAARLAAWHDLPAAYLNKQLQALARAGIVTSSPGPRGGFRLARPLADISLMDVVAAVEGTDEAFRCAEIRRRGPGGVPAAQPGEPDGTPVPAPPAPAAACAIAHAMTRAELAWRQALAAQDLDGIRRQAEAQAPEAPARLRAWLAAPQPGGSTGGTGTGTGTGSTHDPAHA